MPQIPRVTINQTIINKTQFGRDEDELIFELVEFGILVWNPRDNIMQTLGYENKNLDLNVISMKIIFNILEMGKTWISSQKPRHLRGNWRRKFGEVTLKGRVNEKKLLFVVVLTITTNTSMQAQICMLVMVYILFL